MAALLNGSVVCLLVLWPLLHPGLLPRQTLITVLTAPAPPAPPAAVAPRSATAPTRAVAANPFAPPRLIPHSTAMRGEPAPAPDASVNPLAGPGTLNASGVPRALSSAPVPAVRAAPVPPSLRVSSGVAAGNRIGGLAPQYPSIARAARVEGVVTLAATIGKSGTVENLRVVSGPPLLTGAAMDAVRSWRYRPYLLNGQPVEVETTVGVIFRLGEK